MKKHLPKNILKIISSWNDFLIVRLSKGTLEKKLGFLSSNRARWIVYILLFYWSDDKNGRNWQCFVKSTISASI